ncbi:MAG: helix-turn-helix domain-containing protein [Hyphomicrobiales bacterium]
MTVTTQPDLSIDTAAEAMAVSRVTIYRLIETGDLDAYKVRKSTRITRESFDRFKVSNAYGAGNKRATPTILNGVTISPDAA